jgi:uncharacterized membrane protein YkgB
MARTVPVSIDRRITLWMARSGPVLLRMSVGVVFVWFGVLKFFPGLSPADELATDTISKLTFGVVQADVSRPVLATWETLIGVGLIGGVFLRTTVALLLLQMAGTVTPLVLFPERCWRPWFPVPTLEGQYIIKNIVIISAALVVGARVRGGGMIASGTVAQRARRDDEARAGVADARA